MNELIKIAHKGLPCDPPSVEGVDFVLAEGEIYVGEATAEQAEALLRIPSFTLFGGAFNVPAKVPAGDGAPAGIPTDEEVDACTAKKDVVALATGQAVTLAADKLADMKVELKAALVALRAV